MLMSGVILFKRNVGDPGQVRRVVAELHSLAPDDARHALGLVAAVVCARLHVGVGLHV